MYFMSIRIFMVTSLLLLVSCKEVVDAPLGNISEIVPLVIEGDWVGSENDEVLELSIRNVRKGDYTIIIDQADGSFSGDMIVGSIGEKFIFNIESSSLRYQGKTIYEDVRSYYRLMGAYVDNGKLVVTPIDMDKFIELLSKEVKVGTKIITTTCGADNQLCNNFFKPSKVLEVKKTKELNNKLLENFEAIFPNEDSVTFNKLK